MLQPDDLCGHGPPGGIGIKMVWAYNQAYTALIRPAVPVTRWQNEGR